MQITDVKVLRANPAVYRKIYTDEGIVGLGERGACSYVRASLGVCGGFTGAKKIAAEAEAHHKSLVPRNPCSEHRSNDSENHSQPNLSFGCEIN